MPEAAERARDRIAARGGAMSRSAGRSDDPARSTLPAVQDGSDGPNRFCSRLPLAGTPSGLLMMPRPEPDTGPRIAPAAVGRRSVSGVAWMPVEGREPGPPSPITAGIAAWRPATRPRSGTFRSAHTAEAPVHTQHRWPPGHSNPITARYSGWRQVTSRSYPAFRPAQPNTDRFVAV